MRHHLKWPSPAMGVALIALFIALGGTTYAATGGTFILGQANTATTQTSLSSGVTSTPTLNVVNTGGRPAARFQANGGKAPFTVSNSTKIANLNVDLLDGLDSTGFLQNQPGVVTESHVLDFSLTNQDVGVLFAEVSAAGVVDNSSGSVTMIKLGLGTYEVDFARDITACTAVATIGPSGGGSALGEVNVADRSGNAEAVFIDTNNSDGTGADKPFRLLVVC